MRGLGSGPVTCGPMRGLEKKLHGEGTYKQTNRQTNGHCDSMTESAHWADSVKNPKNMRGKNYIFGVTCHLYFTLPYSVSVLIGDMG